MTTGKSRVFFLAVPVTVLFFGSPALDAADCNQNGIEDATDILPGDFSVLAAPSYAVGHRPQAVIAADLNGDGRPDLATGDTGCSECVEPLASSVSVLLNRGNGTFEEAVSYPVASSGSLVAADLNGDGSQDFATASDDASLVSVLLNRGDGTFDAPVTYSVGERPQSLIAADLDADGLADLATASLDPGGISVLLNRGDGTFEGWVSYPVPGAGSLVATDLNGDGSQDLATASGDAPCDPSVPPVISVLLNRGDGTFHDAVNYPVAAAGSLARSLFAADLDGDGSQDLATTVDLAEVVGGCPDPWAPSAVMVLLNRGDGTFQEATSYPVGEVSKAITAGDFDGDGSADLATGNSWSGDISILINRGDGTFHDAVSYPAVSAGTLIAVDLDGDGSPDLATGNGGVSVILNRGDGTFEDAVSYVGAGPIFSAADLDGDGGADIATAYPWSAKISVLINRGDGSFRAGRSYPLHGWSHLISSDLNGDGRSDLAAANIGCAECDTSLPPHVSVRLAREDGTFEEAVSFTFGETPSWTDGGRGSPLVAGDFNADGSPDLLTTVAEILGCSQDGVVSVLLNHGDGTFGAAVDSAVVGAPLYLVTADLDADGSLDLATVNCSGDISVLHNRGNGIFEDVMNYPGAGAASLVSADLNGDAMPDLVTAADGRPDGVVSVLLNRGDGTFKEPVSYSVPVTVNPRSLIAADLDGDGRSDLATTNGNCPGCQPPVSSGVSVLLNRGDGTFEGEARYVTPQTANPYALVASDLNGDGKSDLVSLDLVDSILLNRGDGTFQDAAAYPVGGLSIVTDLDGDGRPDLAYLGSDELSVRINSGDGTLSAPESFPADGLYLTHLVTGDFNADGRPDLAAATSCVVLCPQPLPGNVLVFLNQTTPPFSLDLNRNDIPDECEPQFLRGDSNDDGTVDISDPILNLEWEFLGKGEPGCLAALDTNADGVLDISDPVYNLEYQFLGKPAPRPPFPGCGPESLPVEAAQPCERPPEMCP